jgi:hypothetical protein
MSTVVWRTMLSIRRGVCTGLNLPCTTCWGERQK